MQGRPNNLGLAETIYWTSLLPHVSKKVRVAPMNGIEKALVDLLSRSKAALTFDEIYEALLNVGINAQKKAVREALAGLIRNGIVTREPDYERKKMVFRVAEKH
ncbi:MAG TPA: hypothetical protein EYH50_00120 [Pyrodictium delaneyi]|uniref:Uncharacterized protein n=1 Tax=Pyrodictium delaneyi TaxID=1273541 RepID=A0A833E8Q9_9CREN|nr:hypothetical protein [Pyrodictium delaneyi]